MANQIFTDHPMDAAVTAFHNGQVLLRNGYHADDVEMYRFRYIDICTAGPVDIIYDMDAEIERNACEDAYLDNGWKMADFECSI